MVSKKLFLFLISIAIITILVCLLVVSFRSEYSTFSSEKWDTVPSFRYLMFDDFNSKYNLNCMNREDVISILGTNEAYFEENSINYFIQGGFFNKYLWINFDENSEVLNFQIYID